MSVLRPTRKLIDVHGQAWEIYVSRTGISQRSLGRELLGLLGLLGLRPAQEHDSAPQALRVEAVTYLPRPETYRWTTTSDHVGRVIEQIAAGLAAGDLARPLGAVYRGSGARMPAPRPSESSGSPP